MLISGASVVTPDGVLEGGWVDTLGDRIVHVGNGDPGRDADVSLDGGWLVPGFVDMHTHGGGGASVIGADETAVRTVAAAHRAHGTTSIVASLVSGRYDVLEADVRRLAQLTRDGVIAGIHLEGPWISPARKGAHDPHTLRNPDLAGVERLLAAGDGTVRMVTLAPELEGGLAAVRAVVGAGAVAAVGHTDATYEMTRDAIGAGATVATHLFNAMAPIDHRTPGPVPALLADSRVSVELICDGVHLHPSIARLAYEAVGGERVILVTDAMAAASAGDGDYVLGDLAVTVSHGVARLVDGGAIAGSTLTMDRAFAFAVWQAGFSVEDAVRASSANPARLLGIEHQVGAIRPRLRADLVMLDDELRLQRVLSRGEWV